MKQNSVLVSHLYGQSLVSLELTLKEAKVFSPPAVRESHANADEQLAASLIEKVKRQYRWTSPFVNWMGQPFPDEYREMVAADAR